MDVLWANRASSAEAAITARHFSPLWHLPRMRLGIVTWPPAPGATWFKNWHYWWQAHLQDCLIDAQLRDPRPDRLKYIADMQRAHRFRNVFMWTNQYYDDMAWLALAMQRASELLGVERPRALNRLRQQFLDAWMPQYGGGIPWRKQDRFFNTPANGPAAIVLARTGRVWRAEVMSDWIDETLVDPESHLVIDGIQEDGTLERATYTYCQGVVLGLETELAVRTGESRHAERVHRLVHAVRDRMTEEGVIRGSGGGDGGLFNGILARYLALVATTLPENSPQDTDARATARDILLSSAEAAWANRLIVEDLPLFGADWTRTADLPTAHAPASQFIAGAVNPSKVPERDLSVQLSGWMLLEAAHVVA
ncbi:glycoside hydrolase family 76 protein [Mycobacteroides salmoniphilum]|uniref:Glycosyl hydrolase family 76 n=1 Tax=Mycobacteroides salmoniphilum TaxID=404941 RepID=A0A4R8SHF9_9MYCO|nr:glycoside hydrolase family 76 protein [Mycobacteroides salmoniphilum]TDZ96272.1 Glycosyl hydrolase family 76 [Mycobacteroides salmoniphilum]TEA05367.1 Glycosyl hydrolase family 76 [Mycobacteroides salmoniphilum]